MRGFTVLVLDELVGIMGKVEPLFVRYWKNTPTLHLDRAEERFQRTIFLIFSKIVDDPGIERDRLTLDRAVNETRFDQIAVSAADRDLKGMVSSLNGKLIRDRAGNIVFSRAGIEKRPKGLRLRLDLRIDPAHGSDYTSVIAAPRAKHGSRLPLFECFR